MLILGHRGTTVHATENSLAAVEWALAHGADGVEVDVRRTADGVLVCAHDPSMARLGGDDRPVCQLTYADLAAGAVAPPRVAEVLDLASGRGRVILEVKNAPGEPDFDAPLEQTAADLGGLLDERSGDDGHIDDGHIDDGHIDDVVVSSFDWFALDVIRAVRPETATAFLTPPGLALKTSLDYVVEHGLAECHPHHSEVLRAPDQVERAHAAGVPVVCWTVDDPAVADQLAAYGVTGVITNDVTALRR